MNFVLVLHTSSIATRLLWFASLVRFDWLEDCVVENVSVTAWPNLRAPQSLV